MDTTAHINNTQTQNHEFTGEKRVLSYLIRHCKAEMNEWVNTCMRLVDKYALGFGEWDDNEYRLSMKKGDNIKEILDRIMILVAIIECDEYSDELIQLYDCANKMPKMLDVLKEKRNSLLRNRSWMEYLFGIKCKKVF